MPLKMFTMMKANDGLNVAFGIPMSQRFQSQCSFNFSNKDESEFDMTGTYMGAGSQMDEDISFIMANSSSSGRLAVQG